MAARATVVAPSGRRRLGTHSAVAISQQRGIARHCLWCSSKRGARDMKIGRVSGREGAFVLPCFGGARVVRFSMAGGTAVLSDDCPREESLPPGPRHRRWARAYGGACDRGCALGAAALGPAFCRRDIATAGYRAPLFVVLVEAWRARY